MLSIGRVTSAAAAVGYFCHGRGCGPGYYTRDARPGRWLGHGADALGLHGDFHSDDVRAFGRLLDGHSPDGGRLVPPVLRADPASRVRAAPMVAAVRAVAIELGLPATSLLGSPSLARAYTAAAHQLSGRTTRRARGVRADVARDVLTAVGLDPHLVYRAATTDATSEGGQPLADALTHVRARVDTRLPGLDLTFSAPKSVSVLWAFTPDTTQADITAAHTHAVDVAVGWLEREVGHGLRGHHGDGHTADHLTTDGFVAAAFDHTTSRTGDPQLHTHVVVANLLHGVDGAWSAMDTRAVHHAARTAGFLYQAVLRGELTARLGVTWEAAARGTAEITGIDPLMRGVFSTRRHQILRAVAKTGSPVTPAAAQAACLSTRPGKDHDTDPEQLRARWAQQVARLGITDPTRVVTGVLDRTTTPPVADAATVADALLGPAGLTDKATTFDTRDVIRGICDTLPAGAPLDLDVLDQLTSTVLDDPRAVPLAHSAGDAGAVTVVSAGTPGRWSTRGLLDTEQDALDLSATLTNSPGAVADPTLVVREIRRADLTGEHADLVRALTLDPARLKVILGPPGSGKTTALTIAATIWRQSGTQVLGAALSGIATEAMSTAMPGRKCRTIAHLLHHIDKAASWGRPLLNPGAVLIVDEAGMVGTRDLHRLLHHAAHGGWGVVLIGDDHQLPEINAGGLFTHLAATPTLELAGNYRQHAAWERTALEHLRAGDITTALDAYHAHGRVHAHPDTAAQHQNAAAAYLTAAGEHGHAQVGLLTATRASAARLNDLVREQLTERGQLTGPELTVNTRGGAVGYRVGDRVLVTAPDHDRGLLNGHRGHITSLNVDTRQLTLTTDAGVAHTVDTEWAATNLTHGYALTIHKAQGQTHQVTIIVGSAALTAEAGYTALSRGRTEHQLHLAPEPWRLDTGDPDTLTGWLTDHALTDTSRALSTSRRHHLATEPAPIPRQLAPARPLVPARASRTRHQEGRTR